MDACVVALAVAAVAVLLVLGWMWRHRDGFASERAVTIASTAGEVFRENPGATYAEFRRAVADRGEAADSVDFLTARAEWKHGVEAAPAYD